MEFPLDVGYRLLTPRKSPHQFPGGGFSISCDQRSNSCPGVDRINRPIFITYISTVAACSTNSGIWSKFM